MSLLKKIMTILKDKKSPLIIDVPSKTKKITPADIILEQLKFFKEDSFNKFFENTQLEGEVFKYYENGEIKSKEIFKNGILNGESKLYYEDGKIKSIISYVNGKKFGPEKRYNKNGKIKMVVHWKLNKLHGEKIKYNNLGDIILKQIYQNGDLIKSL